MAGSICPSLVVATLFFHSCSDDASISIILIEEMPAYFLGQKDLDAVIKIAQDRIQKVLNERG